MMPSSLDVAELVGDPESAQRDDRQKSFNQAGSIVNCTPGRVGCENPGLLTDLICFKSPTSIVMKVLTNPPHFAAIDCRSPMVAEMEHRSVLDTLNLYQLMESRCLSLETIFVPRGDKSVDISAIRFVMESLATHASHRGDIEALAKTKTECLQLANASLDANPIIKPTKASSSKMRKSSRTGATGVVEEATARLLLSRRKKKQTTIEEECWDPARLLSSFPH